MRADEYRNRLLVALQPFHPCFTGATGARVTRAQGNKGCRGCTDASPNETELDAACGKRVRASCTREQVNRKRDKRQTAGPEHDKQRKILHALRCISLTSSKAIEIRHAPSVPDEGDRKAVRFQNILEYIPTDIRNDANYQKSPPNERMRFVR
jgi:hypothetical protein